MDRMRQCFSAKRHIFLREVDHELLGHGIGCDGREIDHHAAIGQSRIERLDHIDRTDRIDFIAIFNNTAEAFTFEKK